MTAANRHAAASGRPAPASALNRVPSLNPTLAQLEAELARERDKSRVGRIMRNTVYALLAVAAAATLVATLWLPVLQITGTSMEPVLQEGDVVVAAKGSAFGTGDVVALYYGSRILVKRVIAAPGDWVDIADDGTVRVNGATLDEPYISEKSLGKCDIEMPYQVPDGRYFVMGDHRATSVDSRSSSVGCIATEDIVGKVAARAWPLGSIGLV